MVEKPSDREQLTEKPSDTVPWTIQQTFLGIFLTLVPSILLVVGLNSFGGTSSPRRTPLSPQADLIGAIVTFIFSFIIEAAFLIAPLYFANRAFRSSPFRGRLALQALGLRSFRGGQTVTLVVLLLFAIFGIDILYQYLITVLHLNLQTNDQVILENSKQAPLTTYALLIVAVFVAPFCEEVFFRGFVFPGLLRGMPLIWAIVLSSLIFAIAHGDPGSFAVLFIIGLALAFVRLRTKSIWPAIALHTLNNGIGAVAIVLAMQGK